MQANVRLAIFVLALAAAVGATLYVFDRYFPKVTTKIATTADTPEVPVVMRTHGGLLEVATVKAYERFTRSDSKEFGPIWLGTTISQIQVTAVYRYHIAMAKEWPMIIVGKTCIVHAGKVEPSLPVAFDTTTIKKYTESGWARFNKGESLETLERSLTPQLEERAPRYLQLAADAGRQTITEFVTQWLLREQGSRPSAIADGHQNATDETQTSAHHHARALIR